MKIAFLLPINEIAGGLFIIYKQAKNLADQGHEITFIYEKYIIQLESKYQIDSRITIHKDAGDLDDNLSYDLAIATWWKTAFSVLKIKSERYAYFVQSDERKFYDEEASPIDRANRMAVQFTYMHFPGSIITEAKWIVDLFKNEFSRKAYLAPNGIDLNLFNTNIQAQEKKGEKLRFLVEGPANVSFKRVEYTHLCLSKFYKDIEIWHIANDGVFRPYWKAEKVFSKVPYVGMASIMRSCDLIIKLSTVEGFFGPPLEMMACGGTALTSNVTGHDELMKDNVNGYVVQMDNYDQTVTLLEKLISSGRSNLDQLKSNAYLTAQDFEWSKQHPHFHNAVIGSANDDVVGNGKLLKIIGELYLRDPIYFLTVYQ